MMHTLSVNLFRHLATRRGLLPSFVVVLTIAWSSLRASPVLTLGAWAIAASAVALAVAAPHLEGIVAWAAFGAALAIASLAGTGTESPAYAWIDGVGLIGGTLASWAAMRAIARTPASAGLTPSGATSGNLMSTLVAIVWVLGAIAIATPNSSLPRGLASAAPIVTIGAIVSYATIMRARRSLELHAETRLSAATAIGVVTGLVCVAVLVASTIDVLHVARGVIPIGCVAITIITTRFDALAVWRWMRKAAVLAVVGGAAALVMAIFAAESPSHAPIIVLIAVSVSVVIGTQSRALERFAMPEARLLIDAVEDARRRLVEAEPDDAVTVALTSLRGTDAAAAKAELYSLAPMRCTWVDAAGYLHERDAELPPNLLQHASTEPGGVLRADVLGALEVRRPDLRLLLTWMRDAGVLAAVTLVRMGQPEGALLVPRGARKSALSLEEVTALEALATSLGMALSMRAALARSHTRERASHLLAEAESDRAARVEHALSLLTEQNSRATERLARPAAIGIYSAPSRLAYDAALRRTQAQAPLFVHAPSGVDPVPYLARAHLAGPRANAPLVLVDGTSAREHDLERWKDPRVSPLALADKGVLCLLDGAALPMEVQRLIGQSLAERHPPWERPEPLDVVLALSSAIGAGSLIESGRLDPALADRLGDAISSPIEVPRLNQRAEDLRAIVNDRLAREGLRLRGTPLGIDAAAFGRLVEHPFLGEDAELAAIVQRLASTCKGDVVRVEDVDRLGIFAPVRDPEAASPRVGPVSVRNR